MVMLRSRLHGIAQRMAVPRPERLAAQLAVLINGAFVSSGLLSGEEATPVLQDALQALLVGARAGA